MSKSRAGRKPFGFYDDEAAAIEQLILKSRRKSHGKPMTYKSLADSMNKDGHKTQTGRAWYPIAVGRILRKDRQPAVKRPKKVKKTHLDSGDYLTKQEVVDCRAVLRDSDRVLFELLLGAGLRASECCALEVQDIGIYGGRSQIDVQRGKGSRQRAVKIGPKLKDILRIYLKERYELHMRAGDVNFSYIKVNTTEKLTATSVDVRPPVLMTPALQLFFNKRGKQLTYSDLYSRIRKIRTRSGVAALHPHALRHTFGTFLYACKKDLEYCRQQLGHASIATTQIYVNVLSQEKLEQMMVFERSFDP